jgi:hypothetical protein
MKQHLQIVLWLCAHSIAWAQTGVVEGVVLEIQSDQPLPYASVYLNYTTYGTYSDDHGKFQLTGIPVGEYDLIISFIGHRPYQQRIVLAEGESYKLTVRLAVDELQEVLIKSERDEEWEKQLKKFTRLFIGTSANAKECRILNPWVLSFQEFPGGALMAKASQPLEIENMAMGYRLSYQLTNFMVNHQNYKATGFVRFRSIESEDSLVLTRWISRQKKAYEGSTRQLFKSMIEHCLEEDDFKLFEDRSGLHRVVRGSRFEANLDKTIFSYSTEGKIVPDTRPGTWRLQLPARLEVHDRKLNVHSKVYWDIPYPVSWIETKGGYLKVTEDGVVLNPIDMILSGYMFDARIADILPNDYQPDVQYKDIKKDEGRILPGAVARLAERPYVFTDRSYYYPNEVIWIKAFMNYYSPTGKDSLSRVLYVDLLDSLRKSIASMTLPIEQGMATGDITLPSYTAKGNYVLRAYTRWGLNFDTSFVFARPLAVLGFDEAVRKTELTTGNQTDGLQIETDKSSYRPREKVTVTVDLNAQFGGRHSAVLAVAVTDVAQAFPPESQKTILSDFEIPVFELPDSVARSTPLTIQHGIDLSGQFIPSRGKVNQGVITLYEKATQTAMTITTEEDGRFYLPNLMLFDSADYSMIAKTTKRWPGRLLMDSTLLAPPTLPHRHCYSTSTSCPVGQCPISNYRKALRYLRKYPSRQSQLKKKEMFLQTTRSRAIGCVRIILSACWMESNDAYQACAFWWLSGRMDFRTSTLCWADQIHSEVLPIWNLWC